MNGRYLLDTNIVIALFADESAVKGRFGEAEEVFVPSIVLGEWPRSGFSPKARKRPFGCAQGRRAWGYRVRVLLTSGR